MAKRSRGRRIVARELGLMGDDNSSKRGGKRKSLPSDKAIVQRILGKIIRFVGKLAVTFIVVTVAMVILYRFVDPPLSPLMLIRPIEALGEGRFVGISKEWTPLNDIDNDLIKTAIASEDARFFSHGGVDWKAVDEAREYNQRNKGKKLRGASTITMQCARNVFLWQGRNYLRKGLEIYFTYLIEFFWGKERILEVYLNIIEWGEGTYGAEAAAQRYFGTSATTLTPRQAALLISVLPNPRKWSPAEPTEHISKKATVIRERAKAVKLPDAKKEEESREKD